MKFKFISDIDFAKIQHESNCKLKKFQEKTMSGAGSYYLSEEMIEFINNAINRMFDEGHYQFSGCNCTKCIFERKYEEYMSIEKKLRKEQKWKESEQLNSDFRIFERKLDKVDKYV